MMLKIKLFAMFFFPIMCYSQIDCANLSSGTFEISNAFGTIVVEKSNNFQLESSKDFKLIYLEKIDQISDCEYLLKKYKIIDTGGLPTPNMNDIVKIKIYKVEGNSFFYHSQLVGNEFIMDGVLVKTSDYISNEFKEILAQEK